MIKEDILMNQKTAKLLRKYSRFSGKPIKELKDNWLSLSPKERAGLRAMMEDSIQEDEQSQPTQEN